MAINKVSAPNSVPTDVSDYVAQNAHMMAFMNQVNMQAFVLTGPTTTDKPKIALGSYISHGGSLYKVESADEDITGSPSDGKVYVRVTGDASLSASFVTDISSYNYNHAYGTLTSGSYTLLPYEIRKSGSDWLKYRYDAVHRLQADSLNTGQGDNLLYPMNQGVMTTDAVTFATVNTGNGDNIVPNISYINEGTISGSGDYYYTFGDFNIFDIKIYLVAGRKGSGVVEIKLPSTTGRVYLCSIATYLLGGAMESYSEKVFSYHEQVLFTSSSDQTTRSICIKVQRVV